jgi:hypothetical protein
MNNENFMKENKLYNLKTPRPPPLLTLTCTPQRLKSVHLEKLEVEICASLKI